MGIKEKDQSASHNGHDHDHSHDHEHCHHHHHDHVHADDEVEVLRLVLEDDTELECYVLGIFEVREKEYIALLPKDEDEEEVLLYEYREDENGLQLLGIEDDEIYELVAKVFNQAQGEGSFDTCEAD